MASDGVSAREEVQMMMMQQMNKPSTLKHADLNITKNTLQTTPETRYSINIHLFLRFFPYSQRIPRLEGQYLSIIAVEELLDPGQVLLGNLF